MTIIEIVIPSYVDAPYTLKAIEYAYINHVLQGAEDHKGNTAKILGISDRGLRHKIEKMREAGYDVIKGHKPKLIDYSQVDFNLIPKNKRYFPTNEERIRHLNNPAHRDMTWVST